MGVAATAGATPERLLTRASDADSAVSKALTLLVVIAQQPGASATLSELSVAVGIPKSSTHRLLAQLQSHGFVDRVNSKYRIGPGALSLSVSAGWSQWGTLREVAQPVLEALFERTRMTVHLAVLEGSRIYYLEKITAPRGCGIPSRVGSYMPAVATALGKAILAHSSPEEVRAAIREAQWPTPRTVRDLHLLHRQLESARTDGVAVEHEESKLGLSCVAAPIIVDQRPIGAISVSGYLTTESPTRYAGLVKEAARTVASSVAVIS